MNHISTLRKTEPRSRRGNASVQTALALVGIAVVVIAVVRVVGTAANAELETTARGVADPNVMMSQFIGRSSGSGSAQNGTSSGSSSGSGDSGSSSSGSGDSGSSDSGSDSGSDAGSSGALCP